MFSSFLTSLILDSCLDLMFNRIETSFIDLPGIQVNRKFRSITTSPDHVHRNVYHDGIIVRVSDYHNGIWIRYSHAVSNMANNDHITKQHGMNISPNAIVFIDWL